MEPKLIRTRAIRLTWVGDQVRALAGTEQDGINGFGNDVPAALADLAEKIRQQEATIWVPLKAKQFMEDGLLKSGCPECGHISVMAGLDEVLAYVCESCGAGLEVAPLEK